jgi:hypothetical protein
VAQRFVVAKHDGRSQEAGEPDHGHDEFRPIGPTRPAVSGGHGVKIQRLITTTISVHRAGTKATRPALSIDPSVHIRKAVAGSAKSWTSQLGSPRGADTVRLVPSLRIPQPPADPKTRRLILLVLGVVVFVAVGLVFKGDTPPSSSEGEMVPTTTVATEITTTTLDAKAIQSAVANLLAHEGATPQELASVPSNSGHARAAVHHVGSSHTKH